MLCFYHSADLDGHCSGAIVKHFYPDCEMVGIDYGQPFPWEKIPEHEMVWMVDFSLQPFSDMVKLSEMCCLTWIDHHKTAIEEFKAAGDAFRGNEELDSDYAACELTWEYIKAVLGPNTVPEMPEPIYLLGRYDIWKHAEVRGALEFQYGMRAFADTWPNSPIGMECWREIFSDKQTSKIINDGVTFLQYERNQNAKFIAAYGFEAELDGLRLIACNKGFTNSLVFESRWDSQKYDAMCAFAWKNGKWTVSLYTDKPGIDVSAVCKARGGGGHKGAAGFQCSELPWTDN